MSVMLDYPVDDGLPRFGLRAKTTTELLDLCREAQDRGCFSTSAMILRELGQRRVDDVAMLEQVA